MDKSPDAFRTISEVSDWLNTPAHVLRFWESRFTQVRPVKRAGGRRYYRPADVALLGGIKKLLHEDGMTIRGVQKMLREQGIRHVASLGSAPGDAPADPASAPADTAPPAVPPAAPPEEPAAPPPPRPRAAEPPAFAPRRQRDPSDAAPDSAGSEQANLFALGDDEEDAAWPAEAPRAETPRAAPIAPASAAPSGAPVDRAALLTELRGLEPGALAAAAPRLATIFERLAALRDRIAAPPPKSGE